MIGLDETRNTDDSTSVTTANDKSNTSNSSKKDKAQTEEANKFEETNNQPSQKKSSDSADRYELFRWFKLSQNTRKSRCE